jgi:hypothetical protein
MGLPLTLPTPLRSQTHMKGRKPMIRTLQTLLLAAAIAGCTSTSDSKPAAKPEVQPMAAAAQPPLSTDETILTTVTATVKAIDHKTREVTLQGPLGDAVTFTADKHVQRLDEINVGDEVTAHYYVSVAGELRAPTEDEKQHPLVVLQGAGRAPKGADPAAGALRGFRVVTEVVGIDLPTQTVTLKGQGPLKQTVTVRAKSADNLRKLRIGDTIIVTYTEALAVSVEKVSKM